MSKYPSQMQDKFNLRFPDGMRDAIAERAKRNGRSMNSEIVQILENALTSPQVGGTVKIGVSENSFVEIDPNKPGSVINGLLQLMQLLKSDTDDNKKPT